MKYLLDEIDPVIENNPLSELGTDWLLPVLIGIGVLLVAAAVIIAVAVSKAKKKRPDSVDVPFEQPVPDGSAAPEEDEAEPVAKEEKAEEEQ